MNIEEIIRAVQTELGIGVDGKAGPQYLGGDLQEDRAQEGGGGGGSGADGDGGDAE